ncbi:MAG TPA: sigma 54-interacting transcriptional regulator [Polyangiaceae bacterium]|nr:sigma 54-interacting transcriptional regulator [Polyangiaceae bacterium]
MEEPLSTDDFELPWKRRSSAPAATVLQLCIAWSLEEPERVGECAPVPASGGLLGRGEADDDELERLRFVRQRPGADEPTRPLEGARVSRRQLRLLPLADGELEVESVGRCPLAVNGVPVQRARVKSGDTLTLRNAMVLFVVARRGWPLPQEKRIGGDFPFGEADPHGMVGESSAAWELRQSLAFAARSGEHVLLLGESGAGKELAARAIHAMSARAPRPMAARNAVTLPDSLVDAELFGTAKNYPNAGVPERPGLMGEAHGSTLFLDEIGELSATMQAHLLRVLDRDGEYQRLGDARRLASDFRLIAATNRDPGSLKHDFLARLPLRIKLPGLNERREDLPLLVRHLLRRQCESTGDLLGRFFERRAGEAAEPRIEPDLIELLLRHAFTTHTRELERLLWLALSTSPDDFIAATPEVRAELGSAAPEPELEPDRAAVEVALDTAQGNVTRATRLLGLRNRYVLYRIMRKLGMKTREG